MSIGGEHPYALNGANAPFHGVPQATANRMDNNPPTTEVHWVHVYQWR